MDEFAGCVHYAPKTCHYEKEHRTNGAIPRRIITDQKTKTAAPPARLTHIITC